MKRILRIEGTANRVFEAISNISHRHPHLTLAEAGQKGLLEPKLQYTVSYELYKFPEVWLDNETENN